MQALWVSCHLPHPPVSGGRLRELELLRRIASHIDVQVIAVSKDAEHDRAHLDGLRAAVPLAGAEVHGAETDAAAPCTIVGRHSSRSASRAVSSVLAAGGVDLVHLEGFYLAQHLPPDVSVPVVLVDQNVEFDLWRQRADGATGALGDDLVVSHWRREAQRCRVAEVAAWRLATQCVAVTEDDAAVIRRAAPDVEVAVVPDGADHLPAGRAPLRPHQAVTASPRLLYLGNYAYEPNVDAARFLVDEVLPLVRAARPTTRLSLVGNAPPDWLRHRAELDPLLDVTGRVPDVRAHLSACDVMVVPLRFGGGVKVKVLEGLAAGVPIVTTPVGVQGLPRGHDAPLVVAPIAGEVARAVLRTIEEPSLRRSLSAAARHLAGALPTWDDAAAALLETYELARTATRAESA